MSKAFEKSKMAISTCFFIGFQKVVGGCEKLAFTRKAGAEAMVEVGENVVGLKVEKNMVADDVLKDFIRYGGEGNGAVILGQVMVAFLEHTRYFCFSPICREGTCVPGFLVAAA